MGCNNATTAGVSATSSSTQSAPSAPSVAHDSSVSPVIPAKPSPASGSSASAVVGSPAQGSFAPWPEGSLQRGWRVVFDGYGAVSANATAIRLRPRPATAARTTHAALVVSQRRYTDVTVLATVTTTAQLRRGSQPHPWEVGWVLWQYADPNHFYALTLKPNGWELSKQDPAYRGGQRFLASGTAVRFPIGRAHHVTISQRGALITVVANGRPLVTVTDRQRPYRSGSVGLYCEDADVLFRDVRIRG